jgi:hypothetical protein
MVNAETKASEKLVRGPRKFENSQTRKKFMAATIPATKLARASFQNKPCQRILFTQS